MENGKYDIIYISFSDLRTDGRSRNFLDIFSNLAKKVFTISLAGKDEAKHTNNKDGICFKLRTSRFILKWYEFQHYCFYEKYPFYSTTNDILVFAADMYSLPSAISISKKLKRKSGSRVQLIYDSREIFSALGPLSGQSFKQKIISYLEKRFIRKVDKFVVSGELDAEYLKSYFKTEKPFFVIKNYPKKQEIVKTNYLRERFNISTDKKILVYQGVLLGGRGIMPVLKAMNQLRENYAFCIIGSGGKEEEFRKYVLDYNLQDCVYFHTAVEYTVLLNITASADIGLCLIEPISFSYELALPNKLFEYIACGLPVLVSDLPALRKVIEENELGGIIPRTLNKSEIIDALTNLEKNYGQYKLNLEQKSNEFFFEGQEEIVRGMLG